MHIEAAIFESVDSIQFQQGALTISGTAVRITPNNKQSLFNQFGAGIAAIAIGGPKTIHTLSENVEDIFVGVGKLSAPDGFNINCRKTSLLFHRPTFSPTSRVPFDDIVKLSAQLQTQGIRCSVDALNYLMRGV